MLVSHLLRRKIFLKTQMLKSVFSLVVFHEYAASVSDIEQEFPEVNSRLPISFQIIMIPKPYPYGRET
ncbi:MAG: hypothetical protein HBSAPP01_12670 [Candidatus Brocadia sapporoensis]|nr:MAG: hypothetical protein HBSAPP01_12670 [Candidatus Brocadia sapporoensis]